MGQYTHKGENASNAKLTEQNVLDMRSLYRDRKNTVAELARLFDVSPATVRGIVRRWTWKHIK